MYMKLQNIMVAAILLTAAIPSIYARQTDDGRHRYAIVNLSVNFLREGPDYTAELGTQALMGDVVMIVAENGYWRQVITEEPYTAWCTDLGLVELDASELEEYLAAPKYICTAWKSTVYSSPSAGSMKICDLVEGDIMRQSIKTRRHLRPVTRRGFAEIIIPDGRTGYVPRKDVTDYGRWEAGRDPSSEIATEIDDDSCRIRLGDEGDEAVHDSRDFILLAAIISICHVFIYAERAEGEIDYAITALSKH